MKWLINLHRPVQTARWTSAAARCGVLRRAVWWFTIPLPRRAKCCKRTSIWLVPFASFISSKCRNFTFFFYSGEWNHSFSGWGLPRLKRIGSIPSSQVPHQRSQSWKDPSVFGQPSWHSGQPRPFSRRQHYGGASLSSISAGPIRCLWVHVQTSMAPKVDVTSPPFDQNAARLGGRVLWRSNLLSTRFPSILIPFYFYSLDIGMSFILNPLQVFSLKPVIALLPPGGIVLEVNWSGEILQSWHSNLPGRFISEARIFVSWVFILFFISDPSIHLVFLYRTATCTWARHSTIFWAGWKCLVHPQRENDILNNMWNSREYKIKKLKICCAYFQRCI